MSENAGGSLSVTGGYGEEQSGLPFERYQRYRVATDALKLLRKGSEALRILDAEGAEGAISGFLADDEVTVLAHTENGGAPGLEGAGVLPFEDGAFDYAVSAGAYERVEAEGREVHLSELRRVARRGVLLVAPFDSEAVREAERLANDLHRSIRARGNALLDEHAENGLPSLTWSREFFEARGDRVSVLPNGYLPHWLAMACLTFYRDRWPDEMRSVAERICAFYDEFVYEHDNVEPSYRHLLVALREEEGDAADLGRLLPPPAGRRDAATSAALLGAFVAPLSLAPGLEELGRQLAQKDHQLRQKEAQIRDLTRRLGQQTAAVNLGAGRHLDAIRRSGTWRRALEKQRNLRTSFKSGLMNHLSRLGG